MQSKVFSQRFSVAVAALLLVALLLSAAALCAPQTFAVARAEGEYPWYYDAAYLDLSPTGAVASAGAALADKAAGNVSPVIVAVIDTGVDRTAEGMAEVLLKDSDGVFVGYNAYTGSDAIEDWQDAEGTGTNKADFHGTKVAGVIAETVIAAGLQDYIKIYPIKASEAATNKFTVSSVAAAVEKATEIGADVINLSLCSSPSNIDVWVTGENAERLKRALSAASADTVIVAAAGNEAKDSESTLYYPAAYDSVVGVMSYGKAGTVYGGSNGSNYGAAYDIFAPGESIESAGYTTTGTSMAAGFVSAAAAMLRLNLEVQAVDTGAEIPRATALSRLLYGVREGDKTVADPNGDTYKAVSLYDALTVSVDDIDAGYLPATGINVTGTTAAGDVLTSTEKNKLTVQTVREKYGKGKSLVNLSADLLPEWDVNPDEYANVSWIIEEYTEEKDDNGKVTSETVVEGSRKELGTGRTVQYLFEEAGLYRITASVVGEGGKVLSSEMEFEVSCAAWIGSEAHIVPVDYVESQGYADGTGKVPSSVVSYKSGVSLTVTSVEDMDVAEISWYVDGRFAGNGKVFDYKPSSVGEHNVTAYVRINEGDDTTTYKITGSFLVDCRSYAEHPGMIAFWCVLGAALVTGAVLLAVRGKKRKDKAALAAAEQEEENGAEDMPQEAPPIRKERSTPPPPPEPVKKSKRKK